MIRNLDLIESDTLDNDIFEYSEDYEVPQKITLEDLKAYLNNRNQNYSNNTTEGGPENRAHKQNSQTPKKLKGIPKKIPQIPTVLKPIHSTTSNCTPIVPTNNQYHTPKMSEPLRTNKMSFKNKTITDIRSDSEDDDSLEYVEFEEPNGREYYRHSKADSLKTYYSEEESQDPNTLDDDIEILDAIEFSSGDESSDFESSDFETSDFETMSSNKRRGNRKPTAAGLRKGVSIWDTKKWTYEDDPIEDFVVDDINESYGSDDYRDYNDDEAEDDNITRSSKSIKASSKSSKPKKPVSSKSKTSASSNKPSNNWSSQPTAKVLSQPIQPKSRPKRVIHDSEESEIEEHDDELNLFPLSTKDDPLDEDYTPTQRRKSTNLRTATKCNTPPKVLPMRKSFPIGTDDNDDNYDDMNGTLINGIAFVKPLTALQVSNDNDESSDDEEDDNNDSYNGIEIPGFIEDSRAMYKPNKRKAQNYGGSNSKKIKSEPEVITIPESPKENEKDSAAIDMKSKHEDWDDFTPSFKIPYKPSLLQNMKDMFTHTAKMLAKISKNHQVPENPFPPSKGPLLPPLPENRHKEPEVFNPVFDNLSRTEANKIKTQYLSRTTSINFNNTSSHILDKEPETVNTSAKNILNISSGLHLPKMINLNSLQITGDKESNTSVDSNGNYHMEIPTSAQKQSSTQSTTSINFVLNPLPKSPSPKLNTTEKEFPKFQQLFVTQSDSESDSDELIGHNSNEESRLDEDDEYETPTGVEYKNYSEHSESQNAVTASENDDESDINTDSGSDSGSGSDSDIEVIDYDEFLK